MSPPVKRARGRPRKTVLKGEADADKKQVKRKKAPRRGKKNLDETRTLKAIENDGLKETNVIVLKPDPDLNERVEKCEGTVKKNSRKIEELESVLGDLKTIIRASESPPFRDNVFEKDFHLKKYKPGLKPSCASNSDDKSAVCTELSTELKEEKDVKPFYYGMSEIQENIDKPVVLRKFRPPKSKYQLEEERKATSVLESSENISYCASTSSHTEKIPGEVPTSHPTKIGIPDSIDSPETSTVSELLKSSSINASHPIIDLTEPSSECLQGSLVNSNFASINSWIAKNNPHRSNKEITSLNKMKTKEGLISTYKCMARCCSYASTSQRNFSKHLQYHESANSQEEFLYLCPYCIYEGKSSSDLVDHYRIHFYDKFQCGYCFYRSTVDSSCIEHVKSHHSEKPDLVYETPLEAPPPTQAAMSRLLRCRKSQVKALVCSTCSLSFYSIDAYELHIDTHSSNSQNRDTATQDYTKLRAMIKNNEIGVFECLFCAYASNFRGELRSHMQEHPSELLFICRRSSSSPVENPHSLNSVVICDLASPKDLKIVPYDPSLSNLKNTLNVAKIVD